MNITFSRIYYTINFLNNTHKSLSTPSHLNIHSTSTTAVVLYSWDEFGNTYFVKKDDFTRQFWNNHNASVWNNLRYLYVNDFSLKNLTIEVYFGTRAI